MLGCRDISWRYRLKRDGPNTEPRGTPAVVGRGSERFVPILTQKVLSAMNDANMLYRYTGWSLYDISCTHLSFL